MQACKQGWLRRKSFLFAERDLRPRCPTLAELNHVPIKEQARLGNSRLCVPLLKRLSHSCTFFPHSFLFEPLIPSLVHYPGIADLFQEQ
jgi:hypothetical protein